MTIIFDDNDRELVREKLKQIGLYVDEQRITDVLYNVKAAYLQQLDYEADYMINDFEVIE